ncbi:MAG: glycosyltransferase [Actinomycetota bacterium]|nr:glycosyltransferase [Actinomycetota bacterium]
MILPTRNGAATIGAQLEALAGQSSGGWELIVSDNGSTDSTLEIVETFRGRLPDLRIVDSSDRAGPAHAANVGARAARGPSLAFCNDDDLVGAGWVRAMTDAVARHGFVAGRLDHERLNEPWMLAVRGKPQADGLVSWPVNAYLPYAFACTLGVRRELHDRIGGFDEALRAGEDIDYCWRLQQLGVELHFAPAAVTHYRFRRGLWSTFTQARTYGEANARVYTKHLRQGRMPPIEHPWRLGIRNWARVVKRALGARSRTGVGLFLWELGWRLGTARASAQERVVFL